LGVDSSLQVKYHPCICPLLYLQEVFPFRGAG
jgi:hypothetical protein